MHLFWNKESAQNWTRALSNKFGRVIKASIDIKDGRGTDYLLIKFSREKNNNSNIGVKILLQSEKILSMKRVIVTVSPAPDASVREPLCLCNR